MQYLTRWKPTLGIILTALIVCLCAVPNFFPEATVKGWPAWAQRRMVLGLDLQGGSYLLLEVDSNDVKKSRLDQIREDVQRTLRAARIQYYRACGERRCGRGPHHQGHAIRRMRCRNCAICRSRSAGCSAAHRSAISM